MAKQWREIYNEWEKAVAPGLQQFAASDGFRDFMAASAKVSSAFAAEFERTSRRWLHFWNLPAATDVRKLRQQVAAVDRELKGLKNLVFDVVAVVPAEAAPATNGEASAVSKPAAPKATASKTSTSKTSASKATASKATASKATAKKPAAQKPAAAVEKS